MSVVHIVSESREEGWPMRGLELIMWSEGQWEASNKITMKGDKKHMDIATTRPKRPKGRFGENWYGNNCTNLIMTVLTSKDLLIR